MNNLEFINSKILFQYDKKTNDILNNLQSINNKIIFTNGVFDIIHRGHIEYLSKSADIGGVFIIGLNSDISVKKLNKGDSRPIQDEYSRALIISSMVFVDYVVLFDEETPYELIKKIQPDVIVKGSDYDIKDIVGYDIIKDKGGEVVTIDYLTGFSTTIIEKKIIENIHNIQNKMNQ
jgi:rfaE bifunctional protein nucleotidyltransferase chain/domain